jgi:hypothetical protein
MVTPEQGLIDLENTYKREVSAGWEFIRKLVAYVEAFGQDYYYEVADHMGLSPKTLRDYASIARNPISHYAEGLGLTRTHAQAVLGLVTEEAKALLLQSAEEGLSADWLRYEVRQRSASMRIDAPRPTGSATAQGGSEMSKTYHATTTAQSSPVPVSYTAICDGATQHRHDAADPYLGVVVAESDDVPFADPAFYMDGNDTAYDIAERIVMGRGVAFAKLVAAEIVRWGEWQ